MLPLDSSKGQDIDSWARRCNNLKSESCLISLGVGVPKWPEVWARRYREGVSWHEHNVQLMAWWIGTVNHPQALIILTLPFATFKSQEFGSSLSLKWSRECTRGSKIVAGGVWLARWCGWYVSFIPAVVWVPRSKKRTFVVLHLRYEVQIRSVDSDWASCSVCMTWHALNIQAMESTRDSSAGCGEACKDKMISFGSSVAWGCSFRDPYCSVASGQRVEFVRMQMAKQDRILGSRW